MAYTIVLPALTPEDRERYYAESRLFAALFGIPQASLSRRVGGLLRVYRSNVAIRHTNRHRFSASHGVCPASQFGLHRLTWKDRSKPRALAAFCRYGLVSVCAEFGNGGAIPTSCLSMPFLVSRFCRVHPGPRVLPTFFLAAAHM